MKCTKAYNMLNKFIHIITPLTILIYSFFVNLGYNEIDDPGGWGGLALAGNIILSIGWILAVLFIVFLFNSFCKKESSKGIIKLVISILNILIWISNGNFFVGNSIIFLVNIFLVIITGILLFFCKIRKNTTNQSNNVTIDYELKKEDKTNRKEKTNLYKIFIVLSILICIFLLPFVNSMTSKFPTAYPGDEASSGVITSEIANQIAIYVWPILIVYSIMIIILIIKKTNYRKVYYPLSLFTLTVIIFNLGIIYSGYMIFWYLLIFFYPLIALMVVLSIIGNKLDNNTISKKKVSIILVSTLLLASIPPIFTLTNLVEKLTEFNYELTHNVNFEIERINNSKINIYFFDDNGYYYSIEKMDYTTIGEINIFVKKNSKKRLLGMTIDNDIKDKIYISDYKGGKKLVYEPQNAYDNNSESNQFDTNKLNEIKQDFNTILNSNFISVNDIKLSSDYTFVRSINLLISNEHVAYNEMDFCNSLIQAYENIKELLNKYNYTSQTIHFEFTNNNPFAKEGSTNYKKGGYIRFGEYSDSDRTWYDIYLNPTPIKIN